ncbi:hypothetical protein BJ508DRAFT_99700 [Ascobolus immersus RN42]|uniref:Uncharacterized protein n=1 Tax=Ascobolus immersus RN42 TaxID=1160509 RepID=A0A3N4ICS3_ASCIM|nr:hypothetical protein BJ508DRAFT_99700 [Ascobolus immersus RN42]
MCVVGQMVIDTSPYFLSMAFRLLDPEWAGMVINGLEKIFPCAMLVYLFFFVPFEACSLAYIFCNYTS